MHELSFRVLGSRKAFRPLDYVEGRASWRLVEPPKSVTLRLFWHTEGSGNTDTYEVEEVTVADAEPTGHLPFSMQLPVGPYSFSGALISLLWSLELVIEPGTRMKRYDFQVSPTGEQISL